MTIELLPSLAFMGGAIFGAGLTLGILWTVLREGKDDE